MSDVPPVVPVERELSQSHEAVSARKIGADGLTRQARYIKRLKEKEALTGVPDSVLEGQREKNRRAGRRAVDRKNAARPEIEKKVAARLAVVDTPEARALAGRIRTSEVKALSTRDLIVKLREKLSLAIEYIDPLALAQSSAKDLALITAIFIDKVQVLEGKPTAILGFEERRSLTQLAQTWMVEAKRRGLEIDLAAAEAVEVPVAPLMRLPGEFTGR